MDQWKGLTGWTNGKARLDAPMEGPDWTDQWTGLTVWFNGRACVVQWKGLTVGPMEGPLLNRPRVLARINGQTKNVILCNVVHSHVQAHVLSS